MHGRLCTLGPAPPHPAPLTPSPPNPTSLHPTQDLVGKNLTYLSQLDGLTFDAYAASVLPRLLEQVVGCRDEVAQQYLMQVGG